MDNLVKPSLPNQRVTTGSQVASPMGHVVQAGINSLLLPQPALRTIDTYALVYVRSASGHFEDDRGYRVRLTPGDVITLCPGVGTRYGMPGGWYEIYLMFRGPIVDLWRDAGLIDPDQPVAHLEPLDYWFQRFLDVFRLCESARVENNLRALTQTQAILTEIAAVRNHTDPDVSWLPAARRLLDDSIGEGDNLASIAAALGMGYESFRKRFVRLCAEAPGQYRLRRRIEIASHALALTDEPLKTIASRLGFSDVYHFSQQFKRETGWSPGRYRKAASSSRSDSH